MSDTNNLMDFISASLGTARDGLYYRLADCNFAVENPELAVFTVALLNAMEREGHADRSTEVVLMLAFGESGTAKRTRNRFMRWPLGEMSVHDLARVPGLGKHRDCRIREMPMPVRPRFSAQPLVGSKRTRDGPCPSYSADSPTAASSSKKVKVYEIEIQTE